MVVIEIQVHAGRQALGSNLRKVPAGRKGYQHTDLAWSPRKGSRGSPIPRCFLCQISHPQILCAWLLPSLFFAFFLCLRLRGSLGEGLSLSDCPPYRALHPDSLQNVKRRSHLQEVGWPGGRSSGDVGAG